MCSANSATASIVSLSTALSKRLMLYSSVVELRREFRCNKGEPDGAARRLEGGRARRESSFDGDSRSIIGDRNDGTAIVLSDLHGHPTGFTARRESMMAAFICDCARLRSRLSPDTRPTNSERSR